MFSWNLLTCFKWSQITFPKILVRLGLALNVKEHLLVPAWLGLALLGLQCAKSIMHILPVLPTHQFWRNQHTELTWIVGVLRSRNILYVCYIWCKCRFSVTFLCKRKFINSINFQSTYFSGLCVVHIRCGFFDVQTKRLADPWTFFPVWLEGGDF